MSELTKPDPSDSWLIFFFMCAGSRLGISARVTSPTSVIVNTTLLWKRPRFITTPALTYPRCLLLQNLESLETFSSQLWKTCHLSGWEPPGDTGAKQPANDDSGGAVQPAQGEPWWLPRHLQPWVERRLRLTFAHISPPSCRAHQQVGLLLMVVWLWSNMEHMSVALHNNANSLKN